MDLRETVALLRRVARCSCLSLNAPLLVSSEAPQSVSSIELREYHAGGQRSPHYDEVVVLVDGHDGLASIGLTANQAWIGRRPSAVGDRAIWQATRAGHDALVARCSCGEEGCQALVAHIRLDGATVIWESFRNGSDARSDEAPIEHPGFAFDRVEYEAALRGEMPLSSWEPISRIAEQLVHAAARELDLTEQGYRFAGCQHHGDTTVSASVVVGTRGDAGYGSATAWYEIAKGERADAVADRIVADIADGSILRHPALARRPWKSRN